MELRFQPFFRRRSGRCSACSDLNAPIDTWLTFSNTVYLTSVTPEDGLEVTSHIRSHVASQAVIITRTLDLWGRTRGISAIVPYVDGDASSGSRLSNEGFSDLGLMFQMNIFDG